MTMGRQDSVIHELCTSKSIHEGTKILFDQLYLEEGVLFRFRGPVMTARVTLDIKRQCDVNIFCCLGNQRVK